MTEVAPSPLRRLPSVDRVLRQPNVAALVEKHGRAETTQAVRDTLAALREDVRPGAEIDDETIVASVLAHLDARAEPRLKPVFNLTGTVLHTNLGRAVLAEEAIKAATAAMRDAVSLEFDLASGRRGERDDHVRALVCELTGAEDATLVNNNAAAVLLVLNTLAQGREAIVSRGELIEIGGAFRMPEIMARAGVLLREVGTTNRTHPRDYADAMSLETGLILKVHTSNYRIEGFTTEVGARELAKLARQRNVPFVNDLGSGTLVDLSRFGLRKEPTVREAVEEGADLITFSGDKLLGGPQAGFIVGRKDLIATINRNPMKRALRVDKMRLAACEATLRLYRDPDRLAQRLPTMGFLARNVEDVRQQALRLAPVLAEILGGSAVVEAAPCASQIGSGALPLDTIPSFGLLMRTKDGGRAVEALSAAFRKLPWPVIGRVADGALVFDLRCLEDEGIFRRNLSFLRIEVTS
ncbi:L-seryl-tRNA(Sec) selenium transferase [Microvirga mediterraneensis]|uniref:L-seryl-tRNA(Sec) selenium transferase n=1 Tax=Microvirga mediterraneensis TaxID=2754695 RepID=A0A838BTE1_9HYPH|nr:L-seryl-tRNA(Sec) selenium transferase [Microvirga mediterraneensis]MBA1158817.1 L-seryl-tRNA(Sec) selenium transferase [Microvirga mediterraneensis]